MKTTLMRYITFLSCICILCSLLCACGAKKKLSGQWECENSDVLAENYMYFPAEIVLLSDGSGTFNIPYYRGLEDIEWTAKSGRLKVTSDAYELTYDYNLSGKTLTLTYDGVSISYTKK
ncbi:MAG: hypothetical protein IKT58_02345 [Oscillospiraceae bacterium]|nr:hypothetical protein [Oscillospiraceae bacterium]